MPITPTTDNQSFLTDVTYAEVRVWDSLACETYNGRSGGEHSVAIHDVFSEAVPGAFGLKFLRRLMGLPQIPEEEKSQTAS